MVCDRGTGLDLADFLERGVYFHQRQWHHLPHPWTRNTIRANRTVSIQIWEGSNPRSRNLRLSEILYFSPDDLIHPQFPSLLLPHMRGKIFRQEIFFDIIFGRVKFLRCDRLLLHSGQPAFCDNGSIGENSRQHRIAFHLPY